MAASYSDMYPKRKTELEDITNRHKKAKLDKPYYPVQERLPSPSSPSSLLSPHKARLKSVSFKLSKNQHYENSPLLTPKEDDYASDADGLSSETVGVEALTLGSHQQLDENADYIALCATSDMLNETKYRIETELVELRKLRAAAQGGSKLALVDFYVALIYHQARLPGQHKIVRAPAVDWSKYHQGLSEVSLNDRTNTNANENVFGVLNVFRG